MIKREFFRAYKTSFRRINKDSKKTILNMRLCVHFKKTIVKMLIADIKENIYQKNTENIKATLDFYFQYTDDKIAWILENTILETNQIEYIARKVSDNFTFFQTEIPNRLTISNLIENGINALGIRESEWKDTKVRLRISKAFKEIVSNNL